MKVNQFINWLVTSSTDPLKLSLTIRGFLVLGGSWVLNASLAACGFGFYCLGLDQTFINAAVENLTNIAYGLALLFGSVMTVWGLLRKLAKGRWSAA